MNAWQERIAKTGFFTGLTAYVLFWVADLLRPGFVARYLSVHVFLLAAIVFGAWWAVAVRTYRDWPLAQYACAALFGALFAVVTWHAGAAFASYRLVAVAVAFVTPMVALSLARSE